MTKITFIAGAGFYAGVSFINKIAKKQQQQQHAKLDDSQFPAFNLKFDNQLGVSVKGYGKPQSKREFNNEIILCYSANYPFEGNPFSLLNPRWYPTARAIAFCSEYATQFKIFGHIDSLSLVYLIEPEQEFLNSIIFELLSTGSLGDATKYNFLEFIKIVFNKYSCDTILLGCTELLLIEDFMLSENIKTINPLNFLIEELL